MFVSSLGAVKQDRWNEGTALGCGTPEPGRLQWRIGSSYKDVEIGGEGRVILPEG